MNQPKLADKTDVQAIQQLIRISAITILANVIQGQKPAQSFAQCKLEAIEQLSTAVNQDWQV